MRYFYYEPADYQACEEHMAEQLGAWFPETAEECKGSMWNYEGWNLEDLVSALKESGELLPRHLKRLGALKGPDGTHCNALH